MKFRNPFTEDRKVNVVTPCCPVCKGREFMRIKPALTATVEDGVYVETEAGACVSCLHCDTPYVISIHAAGCVIPRRRIAAGVEIPLPKPPAPANSRPSGDGTQIIDSLAKSLGEARILNEPD